MNSHIDSSADDAQEEQLTLRNLHKGLAQLAEELARAVQMSAARDAEDHAKGDNSGELPSPIQAISPRDYFEALLRQCRARDRYFGSDLVGEPAWDIMLELMIARVDAREMKIGELGAAAHAPGIDIRRYVDTLAEAKLIELYQDADPRGDFYLALSSEAARRMAELYRARPRS
ncbi:MAG: hypothetical protein P0Y56_02010 [Candidatus Andeanibacterium colombiense]|uniref:MarR family transcriptional regulator n=1 Tax=Candidatus Andeanibacterium colombiense TaxID=3121345 RepID=A0AAJ5X600_9SPHN|nr:MAG: hypothetical protein P0Y56_02010 [Sphingomonadaceae bacterium]